ncbi:MAG: GntR family transcriptional regulator [Candidatus Omnitrophica bacterium]|nr:GntR family transcriptional regulator [Candidatus Omnitrophota bacterium]
MISGDEEDSEGEVQIGRLNDLAIVKEVDFGLYLDGGEEFGEILLPRRYMPKTFQLGEKLRVFLYCDSEDRLIATTEKPLAMVGEFASLKVVSISSFGAFLDWGLPKDLLLPLNEQTRELKVGWDCVVRVFLDEPTGRIAASAKVDQFLQRIPPRYSQGQEVSLLIVHKTDLGYAAIINDTCLGMLFEHEVFESLKPGMRRPGYIKNIREDGKVDLSLYQLGYQKVSDITDTIMEQLKKAGGFLPLTDKISPDVIYKRFGVSKKVYKKAVGSLYKRRLIVIEDQGIRLAV